MPLAPNEDPYLMVVLVHFQICLREIVIDLVTVFLFLEMVVLIYKMNVRLNTYFFLTKWSG